MGGPGKVKFPIISNHFAKCDHKGELSAVLSAIYYLNMNFFLVVFNQVNIDIKVKCLYINM